MAIYELCTFIRILLSDKKFQPFIQEVGAILFEKAFIFAYSHTDHRTQKNVLAKAREIINDYKMNIIFPQNKLIQDFRYNRLYQYKWINEYSLKQRFFSIKKFRYDKNICFLGLKFRCKRKEYKKIRRLLVNR